MGIEAQLAKMNPKRRKLFNNLISVFIIIIMAFAFFKIGDVMVRTGNYMNIFTIPIMLPIILPLVFLFFAHKLLSEGEKISKGKVPNRKPKKKTIAEPAPPRNPHLSVPKNPNVRKIKGSWSCPKCGFLVVSQNVCPNCKYWRSQ